MQGVYVQHNGQRQAKPGIIPPGEPRFIVHTFQPAALETDQWNWTFQAPCVIYGVTAFDSDAAGFFLQLYRSLPNGSRRMLSKHMPGDHVGGSGQRPALFDSPHYFDAGDSITVEVKNLSNAAPTPFIQVCLLGVDPDEEPKEAA